MLQSNSPRMQCRVFKDHTTKTWDVSTEVRGQEGRPAAVLGGERRGWRRPPWLQAAAHRSGPREAPQIQRPTRSQMGPGARPAPRRALHHHELQNTEDKANLVLMMGGGRNSQRSVTVFERQQLPTKGCEASAGSTEGLRGKQRPAAPGPGVPGAAGEARRARGRLGAQELPSEAPG